MNAKKVWFNWHCPHCQHRNRVCFSFQFEVPCHYNAVWKCDECLMESQIEFDFAVHGWFRKSKKDPPMKKRIKEKKDLKKARADSKENNSYTNNSQLCRGK